jgi:hypothetical protein
MSAATPLIRESEFCHQFIKNGHKIDYGFNSGEGFDFKVFLFIGNNFWKIKVNGEDLSLHLVSNYSSKSNVFDKSYKMAFSGGADTVGLIDVSNESFV